MIRKVLTLTLALLVAIPVLASADRSRVYTIDPQGKKTYWSPEGKKIGVEKVSQKGAMKKAPALALVGGDPKPLDIEIKYDENEWRFECLVGGIMSQQQFGYTLPVSGIIDVPFGIHGLMCVFKNSNNDFCIVAKDISQLPPNSKVVFDTADCIHKVNYNPVGEDGEVLSVSIRNSEGEITQEGEYLYAFAMIGLNNVNDNIMWTIDTTYLKYINNDGQLTEIRAGDIYFNDCGSDFYMNQYIIGIPVTGHNFTAIEMPVYVGDSSKEATEIVLSNDPSKYQIYRQQWTRSPYSQSQNDELCYGCHIGIDLLNTTFSQMGVEIMDSAPEVYNTETQLKVCYNDPDTEGSKLASMLLIDTLPESIWAGDLGIGSFWWKPTKDGREYKPLNAQGNQLIMLPYEIPVNAVENNYNSWLLTYGNPNENLAFDHSKAIGRMGNNCPIISLAPDNYNRAFSSDVMPFYIGLVGRYGEGNAAGTEFIEEAVSYEYDENNIRHDVFSYDNVLIDGEVDGEVICDCGIKKGSGMNEDYFPPVLTYLGMHDTSGNLTDRFETGADGVMEFYAADFYFNFDWSLGDLRFPEYSIRPISEVNVEYSPYGKSDYLPLPVSEIADKYYYPGWGSYYSVPLGDVNKNSSNGWFDVRITLKDETGNFQVQTISPAFKVLSASGVKDINETFDNTTPVYYNMQGVRVSSPEKGIYIEKIGNNTRKVIK